jgi:hypothetical protein
MLKAPTSAAQTKACACTPRAERDLAKKEGRPGFGSSAEAGAAGPGHRGPTLAADPRGQDSHGRAQQVLNLAAEDSLESAETA